MIKCGIIGFGKMGKIRASAIEKSKEATIAMIYDEVYETPVQYPKAKSILEIVQSQDIDAIFVCTPNYLIPEICIEALKAGKHVFSEKPPAFNSDQLKKVQYIYNLTSGQKLMYGFNHRHHESIMMMKKIINDSSLGKIIWMRGRYGKEVDESYFKNWRANPELSGAGILLDQGIHMVDLMIHMCGGFDQVHAFVSNSFWNIEGIEDNVFSIMKNNESGVTASVHSTMTQWRYLFSLEVFLEGGALILNGLKTSSGAYGDEILTIKRNEDYIKSNEHEREETHQYHVDNSWFYETEHFLQAVKGNLDIKYGNLEDAMKLMELIDQIYESGKLNNGK
jgi:1,5-anhydro-D-fructose reductase (1,5-anhydro-D-mannitol-forming)